jgi:hypothetical protein
MVEVGKAKEAQEMMIIPHYFLGTTSPPHKLFLFFKFLSLFLFCCIIYLLSSHIIYQHKKITRNNIRMAMESTIALAVAMGRTLVMPPQKKMYLLGKSERGQQHHFTFVDFFPIEEMAQDNQRAFHVITMKEYLQSQAMTGKLTNKVSRSYVGMYIHIYQIKELIVLLVLFCFCYYYY